MGFFSVNLSYLPLETFSTYSFLQPGAPGLDCPHKEPPLLACFKPASHSFLMMLPSSEGETQPLSHCTHGCNFSHFFPRVRDLVFSRVFPACWGTRGFSNLSVDVAAPGEGLVS